MQIINAILVALTAVLALTGLLFAWSVRKRDLGVADLGWTLGVALCGVLYALMIDVGDPARRTLVAVLAGTWSLRLATHIFRHRVHRREEDARYRNLRTYWGDRARFYVPAFFLGQAVLAVLFSLPLLVAMSNPVQAFTLWDAAGIVVWLVAVLGEGVADRQLETFRADPTNRNTTCRRGLWASSRHPNYFFEWIHWFAYILLAVGSPYVGWTLAGPIVMLVFLFGVTGIPHTERQALARRGEDYRRYQETTSMFIPWFKRQKELP